MIDMTIEQKGLRELDEKLKLLPLEIQRTIGQRALNKGARLVRDEARRRAPVGKAFYRYPYGTTARNRKRIGQLRDSIVIAKGKPSRGAEIVTNVKPRLKTGYYGLFIEKGWIPTGRTKGVRRAYGLTARKARARMQRGRAKVPGRPFIEPALVMSTGRVLDAIQKELGRLIEWRMRKSNAG